eukprot:TRINITY_DN11484_c0_g1_i1.p1 TRINITY_DN11484_c0_g1~~TRINITY_DN11484_c0_g1_i1.p1  ORF type:complete len:970 (-),score=148.92 TRINITY_DN11484_c0_g1_i1:91-3000(-)
MRDRTPQEVVDAIVELCNSLAYPYDTVHTVPEVTQFISKFTHLFPDSWIPHTPLPQKTPEVQRLLVADYSARSDEMSPRSPRPEPEATEVVSKDRWKQVFTAIRQRKKQQEVAHILQTLGIYRTLNDDERQRLPNSVSVLNPTAMMETHPSGVSRHRTSTAYRNSERDTTEDEDSDGSSDVERVEVDPEHRLTEIIVTVIQAGGLPQMDVGSKSDPYVRVKFGERIFTTSCKEGTHEPVWNETAGFPISDPDLDVALEITVLDKDLAGSDLMGQATLVINSHIRGLLYSEPSYTTTLELKIAGTSTGHIEISLEGIFSGHDQTDKTIALMRSKSVVLTKQQTSEDSLLRSRRRRLQLWQTALLFVLMWNTFNVPLRFCFNSWASTATVVIDHLVDLVYYINMYIKMTYPQEVRGVMIVDVRQLARNYVKHTFFLDLCGCFPVQFFAAIARSSIHELANPAFRVNRFVNAIYAPRLLELLFENFFSSVHPIIVRLLKLLLVLLYAIHLLACFGFLVVSKENSTTWFDASLFNWPMQFQYFYCFYWAMTSTTGYSGVYPDSELDHALALVVLFSGVCGFATVLAAVSNLIAGWDGARTRFREKLDSVVDFMRYKGLPPDLQQEIIDYYKQLWAATRYSGSEDHMLEELPEQLQNRLLMAMNSEIVRKVPIFKEAIKERDFLAHVVLALEAHFVVPGTDVVRRGTIGNEMFFIAKGELSIINADDQVVATLKDGDFFGEMSLLFQRPRSATIRATTFCNLFRLDKKSFNAISRLFPAAFEKIKQTAEERQLQLASLPTKKSLVSLPSTEGATSAGIARPRSGVWHPAASTPNPPVEEAATANGGTFPSASSSRSSPWLEEKRSAVSMRRTSLHLLAEASNELPPPRDVSAINEATAGIGRLYAGDLRDDDERDDRGPPSVSTISLPGVEGSMNTPRGHGTADLFSDGRETAVDLVSPTLPRMSVTKRRMSTR